MRDATAQTIETASVDSVASDTSLSGLKFFNYKHKDRSFASSLPGIREGRLYSMGAGNIQTEVVWNEDSTYSIQQSIFGYDLQVPTVVDFQQYRRLKQEQQKTAIRDNLIQESKSQLEEGRGLLDFSINVPGGESSAFTTLFGTNEVNLRVNGSANMNIGASIQNIDDPAVAPELRRQVDPTFNQNLQLNIQGTIGDKLTIATDWDTERQFDFENRLSIRYEGYEDEIIKSIEMGNVSMATGNSLVKGGSSLFGIKAVTELGPLKVTSVVSQQKGRSNTQQISGGSQENQIDLRPADYEDGRHFFLDFYNRQEFEFLISDPAIQRRAYDIIEYQVYIKQGSQNAVDENAIDAIALLDFGVNENSDGTYGLPTNDAYPISQEQLEILRDPSNNATNQDFGAASQEFSEGSFKLLEEGTDYILNQNYGFISILTSVNADDAIAVAYTYRNANTGETEFVGEITPQSTNKRFLKLLRPAGMTTTDRAWPLTMRNIYSLGVSGFTQDAIEVEIADTRSNIPIVNLPGRSQTLLEDLGLDRVATDGSPGSDQILDFIGGVVNAQTGRIMFPYLEPFGDRLLELLALNPSLDDSTRQEIAFDELYDIKATDARNQSSKNNFYRISGVSSGGVSSTFNLGFGLIDGSVKVTANGVSLSEGIDYEVDYSFGLLTILNDKYLASGQEIDVEYESNQLVEIGQKNFTGIRAEYSLGNNVKLGSTYFHLSEQPLSDKIRIGSEPINNTVLGLDASGSFDTPWLTRAIDRIPLLQTRTPSNFTFSGEFAQLRPGVAQTNAVEEAIDRGDLFKDEENGLVFIDDFEGAEYSISFVTPTRWNLAAAPAALPGYDADFAYFSEMSETTDGSVDARKERTDLRSQFSWYSIPRNLSSISNAFLTAEVNTVFLDDVFQGRVTNNAQEEIITTLDVYFDPSSRGQYNYNPQLRTLLEQTPERTWGGMTAVIPPGQEDLVQNNIEFLEFWVQAVLPDGQDPTGLEDLYSGKLYIDLGTINEDIVPNSDTNTEDGFSTIVSNLVPDDDVDARSYVSASGSPPNALNQFTTGKREIEDIGLDGAPNPGTNGAEDRDESVLFEEFIEAMRIEYGESSEEFQAILEDPSNDDYVYYDENRVQNLNLNERFFRLLGYHDGNTPESGGSDGKIAITLKPDTEALLSASSVQKQDAYYQYEVDLNPAAINDVPVGSADSYIVDKIESSIDTYRNWYLVRIPIVDFTRKYGDIENFQNITHMRMWMSGYQGSFTLRFATFEFVGSQWNKIENLTESPLSLDNFEVSTINIEENANRVPFPYRQPEGSIRAVNRGTQVQSLANEQSIVLGVENLAPGEIHMVKKVYAGGLNLLNYSNMRMFVHGEGEDLERGDVELVIRMGNDLENNYYEYRQFVEPSIERTFNYTPNDEGQLNAEAQEIWRYEENSMNILISAFNVLKQLRDESSEDTSVPFSSEQADAALGEDVAIGATLAIKGNPSLDNITEIGMGIKNPTAVNQSAEFWLNELRVSGFDNENGWAASVKSSIKFADFATLNTNFTQQTTGFGGLESKFDDRSVSDNIGFGLSSTVNLHKLVPDRYGWNFPVTVSTRTDTRTPKYLPDQGDIRLTDFIDAVNSDPELTSNERNDIINDRINEIETTSESFSINFSDISKKNSKSNLMKYTVDNMRLTYVYNTSNAKNPQLAFENKWDYRASFSYNLAIRRSRLVSPFSFTKNIPVLNTLSGLRFGYMPSSITTSSSIVRNYTERRRQNISDPTELQALQQSHTFTQQNSFSLNYPFTPSIPISFRSSTNFDLGNIGIENRNETGIDSSSYDVIPTFDVIRGIVSDTLSARRSNYQESYTTGWRPNLSRIDALNWLSFSTSYGGGFQWRNSARGSGLGASVSNNFQLDNSLKIDTENLLERLGFYNKIKESNEEETRSRSTIRENRRQEIEDEVPDSLRTPVEPPNLLRDARYLGRKVFLSVFSMSEITVGYKRNKTSTQPGYQGDSQIFYAFNSADSDNFSPPLAYRTGLSDGIPQSQLITNRDGNETLSLISNNNITDTFSAGTRINPFPNLSVDLDWSANITSRITEKVNVSPSGEFDTADIDESGGYNVSSWSFGSGYEDLFRRQLRTAYDDINDENNLISDETGNNDGRTVLNRNSLEEDFRKAYLGENVDGRGDKGLFTIPMPSWRINWTRFEKYIPFLGQYMTNATLSHAYRGSYRVDWVLNSVTGLQDPQSLGSAFSVSDFRQDYEPSSLRVEKRFAPLLKLSVTWQSNLRTEFGYDRGTISTLALSSSRVTETETQGVDFSMNYTFRDVRISFLPGLKNNIDLGIRGSYDNDTEFNYELDTDLINALVDGSSPLSNANEAQIQVRETGQQRINGSVSLGYVISSSISSNLEYTYSRIESNTVRPRTNHDIRFNVRIAIRSR